MAEINTIASEEATVTRTGIRSMVSMIGIRIKEPPAPTIPETTPTIKAETAEIHGLYCTDASCTSPWVPRPGIIIKTAAITASTP
ncbi:hypothetical protein BGX30_004268 [Mortierella sp. GBA39]|nr:hypothetical protein BGX30_004268 [Mortierella sp. GBA39]